MLPDEESRLAAQRTVVGFHRVPLNGSIDRCERGHAGTPRKQSLPEISKLTHVLTSKADSTDSHRQRAKSEEQRAKNLLAHGSLLFALRSRLICGNLDLLPQSNKREIELFLMNSRIARNIYRSQVILDLIEDVALGRSECFRYVGVYSQSYLFVLRIAVHR